jgi:hypothetical protein
LPALGKEGQVFFARCGTVARQTSKMWTICFEARTAGADVVPDASQVRA